MELAKQMGKQFREVHLSGKFIAFTNIKEILSDVTLEEATTKIGSLNTLAALAFHINYYVAGVAQVLEGGPLDIRDKYSYDLPPLNSQEDWEKLLDKLWSDAERFATLVEEFPDEKLTEGFVDEKYGNYYRNLSAMTEHAYYHFGQMVIIKKMIREGFKS